MACIEIEHKKHNRCVTTKIRYNYNHHKVLQCFYTSHERGFNSCFNDSISSGREKVSKDMPKVL